jgi:4-amino-4-deoxy-L-arabinose transferase-like glycosyltransferase
MRRPELLVLIAALALSIFLAISFPLQDPDEGRNAEVGREMSAGADWIVPHLAGMPYLDKPPGLFWGEALAIRAFGPTRWAPRLPSILASLLTLLLVAGLSRRLGGGALAWRSVALLGSAPLFAVIGAYVIFDMPLTMCVTAVWVSLAIELAEGASSGRRALMFLAVALGVLIKGPVMLAWALGGSLAAALMARSRAPLRWLAWWPGWLMVLVLDGGWFALACRRFPEYPRYAFVEESLERMTTGSFKREQPWWTMIATLIGGALPWSLLTPWSRARLREIGFSSPLARPSMRVAAGFILFALVFFSLSRSKLVTYMVPAIPPFALLAALAWSAGRARDRFAFALLLVFTPALALVLSSTHLRTLFEVSGEPLAVTIRQLGGTPSVRYEGCYSPGTDYLLNRRSEIVSERADLTTSVYQARYRDVLERRNQWTVRRDTTGASPADVIVRPVRDHARMPAGFIPFFNDRRFIAFRRAPQR